MTDFSPLMPPPGSYRLPTMQLLRVAATENPEVIQLIFQTERETSGQTEQLTISVPLSVLDAAGLIRTLRILQERGIVPIVTEPQSPEKPN